MTMARADLMDQAEAVCIKSFSPVGAAVTSAAPTGLETHGSPFQGLPPLAIIGRPSGASDACGSLSTSSHHAKCAKALLDSAILMVFSRLVMASPSRR